MDEYVSISYESTFFQPLYMCVRVRANEGMCVCVCVYIYIYVYEWWNV